jgi:hypothetical protein
MKSEQNILEMLKEKPEDFVSGEDISGRCGTVSIQSNQLQTAVAGRYYFDELAPTNLRVK